VLQFQGDTDPPREDDQDFHPLQVFELFEQDVPPIPGLDADVQLGQRRGDSRHCRPKL